MNLLQDTVFVVKDTETTGLDPTQDKLVEVAAVAVKPSVGVIGMWATLINPGIPIPPEVSAVHYLTDSDVASAPALAVAEAGLRRFYKAVGGTALVAHNAAFDSGFIDAGIYDCLPIPEWLCTERLARHVWPDAPTFKNQGLRFWRRLNVDTFGIMAHRALGDALVTAALLLDILSCEEFALRNITTLEELRDLSNAPVRFTKWPLGKHYGKPLETDIGYVRWALGPSGMTDMSSDLRYSLVEVLRAG